MKHTFPKSRRLRKRPQFVHVQQNGVRLKRGGLLFLLQANGLEATRLGVTITRRSWPLATRRNRMRRLLREAFRLDYQHLPTGWDMVVIVTRNAARLSLPEARKAITWAVNCQSRKQALPLS